MPWDHTQLKTLREQCGLTQKEVAARMGLKIEDRISHWERGTAMPSVKNLFKLMEIYEVFKLEKETESVNF